jgi:RNA-directed DNA polymerase
MKTEEMIRMSSENTSFLMKLIVNKRRYIYSAFRNCKNHELNALCFLALRSPVELVKLLKTNFETLEQFINTPNYRYYSIPKKRGGKRNIAAPDLALKKVQKTLNYYLQAYYLCIKPPTVYGFVIHPHYLPSQTNIVENARQHTRRRYLLNIDLLDFFTSISASRVKTCFMSDLFAFDEHLCNALTLLTTVHGILPTGSPTSPVISNFICMKLDQALAQFAAEHNMVYSRYADDLSFSSNLPIETNHILDIYSLIRENQFKVNDKKIRLRHSGQRQIVTGLTVNEKPNLSRTFLKQTRAMIYDLKKSGIEAAAANHFKQRLQVSEEVIHSFISRLEGYINFIGQVRGVTDPLYIRMNNEFQQVFDPGFNRY